MGVVRAVCASCERGVPLVSGRIALCICGKKGEKVVANVLPIDDVAAVVALHQKPSDLKTTGGANCCGQLRIRLWPLIQLWPLSCSIAYVGQAGRPAQKVQWGALEVHQQWRCCGSDVPPCHRFLMKFQALWQKLVGCREGGVCRL